MSFNILSCEYTEKLKNFQIDINIWKLYYKM